MLRSNHKELRKSQEKFLLVVGGWWVYQVKTNTALALAVFAGALPELVNSLPAL